MKQDSLPFHAIPDPPENYTAGTVLSRFTDGLGFRYHWATDGLTEQDLDFRVAEGARSTRETLEHVHNIVVMIEYAFRSKQSTTTLRHEPVEPCRHICG